MKIDPHNSPRRRFQFSLTSALITLTVVAGLLGAWKIYSFEPPTDRIRLYEKAEGTRRRWLDVGPNRVSIAAIARNDRDGSLHVEDGEGNVASQLAVSDAATIQAAGPWLDVVEIRLAPGPEQLDIIEARIFDHEKRELISEIDPRFGSRVVDRNVVQVYGLGKALPETLDVWFRLQSYAADDPVAMLGTTAGDSCALPGGTLTLTDIQRGDWSRIGARSNRIAIRLGQTRGIRNRPNLPITTTLSWNGDWAGTKYQIAAITKEGEAVHTSVPQFLRFPNPTSPQPERNENSIGFELQPDALDHFELRPFGGRHRFFFDAVKLPSISTQPFAPPPTAKLQVEGQETESRLTAFAPLDVTIAIDRGNWIDAVQIAPRVGGPMDANDWLTMTYEVRGLPASRWQFGFRNAATGKLIPRSTLRPRFSGQSSSENQRFGYECYQTALDEIGAVEVSLDSPTTTPASGPQNGPAESPPDE